MAWSIQDSCVVQKGTYIMKIQNLLFAFGPAFALSVAAIAASGQTPSSSSAEGRQSNQSWRPVKSIDFSSRHDVLILNPDGTLSPMDEPHFTSKQIAPGTWQILSDGDYMYLVEGNDEAILIDSGYGAGNIREYAQTLTKKPLRYVANTHLHFDHTANDGYFDKAFMSQGTKDGLPRPSGSFAGINFPQDYPIEVIGDAYKFQLGNRELEAIVLGNHTPGGTAYLDRKQRILFSGDEIMGQQGVAIHVSVEEFEKMMERLSAHRKEYDTLCAGWEMLDASWVDRYLAIAQYILAGHQGVPASQAPPAPLPNHWPINPPPVDPNGRTVYIRHKPRTAGVLPPGVVAGAGQTSSTTQGGPAANENIYRVTYGGATVTYDVRKVKDLLSNPTAASN
jgi:glyoxylase-like metal-dependent hydrolase (beta-lactamase superfamily II)